jgi:hypothetical protein
MALYKQVSPEQVDLWLNDPVTKAYLDSLQYCLRKAQDTLADGSFIDPHNVSLTQYNAAYQRGRRELILEALNPKHIFAAYEQPEVADV